MINYIIEASVCLACFYSIYWLFLRKEKLLSLNRFYLLTTALVSLILPLLNFNVSLNLLAKTAPLSSPVLSETIGNATTSSNQSPLLSIGLVYGVGLAVAILLLVIKVTYAKRRIGQKISLKTRPIQIAETDGLTAYSFLNTIFIGKDINKNAELKEHIIAHESAHIEGMHSLDLFFFEILKCLFWFNPFSYFYSKSAKLQHEYIADQHALEVTSPASYQRSLLELTLSQVNSSLISNFNEHPIETRLKMIQKLNSNVMNKLKTLFAVPVLALLFIAFACTDTPEPLAEELEIVELQGDGEYEIKNSLNNELLQVIDSMRIVEGKLKYGFKFDANAAYEEYEIHEIPNSEIAKSRLILENLEKVKSKYSTVIEFIDEQPRSSNDRAIGVVKGESAGTYEVIVEQAYNEKASQEADKVFLLNPDGTRKH